jgi:glycosyltransferase involved in cell wall biosynthesis
MSGRAQTSAQIGAVPVSCIITSYNNKGTIGAAITSVLTQTVPVAEIIVADDCSTDGSQEMLSALIRSFDNVRLVLRPRNLGVAANRDLAVRAAQQPFITNLDGDDLFGPRKVEKEWSALGGSDQNIAFSYFARIDVDRPWLSVVIDPGRTVSGDSVQIMANLLNRRTGIPRDLLLAKSRFIAAGGYEHGVSLYEDWQFKLRVAAGGGRWRHSGTLGTLYFARKGSLSQMQEFEHKTWMAHVVRRNFGLFLQCLGPDDLHKALVCLFGYDVEFVVPEEFRGHMNAPWSGDAGGSGSVRHRRTGLLDRINLRMRMLRFAPEICQRLRTRSIQD